MHEQMLSVPSQPRRYETVHRALIAQQQIVNEYRDIAARYAALDLRPLRIVSLPDDDGKVVIEREGPSPIPQNLLDTLRDESMKLCQLEFELRESYERERRFY